MAKGKPVQVALPKPEGLDDMTAKDKEEVESQMLAGPIVGNAAVLSSYSNHITTNAGVRASGDRVIESLNAILGTVKRVKAGDMRDLEAMLTAQAMTLNKMFESVSLRAQANMAEYPQAARDWMHTALKTQAACRATIEAISEVKNPRAATFIRAGQANVSAGPQQVNNSEAPALPRALPEPAPEILAIPANELLKVRDD